MLPIKKPERILLNCPHCMFSSRYDIGFIADAIKEQKTITCVVCGGFFKIVIQTNIDPNPNIQLQVMEKG